MINDAPVNADMFYVLLITNTKTKLGSNAVYCQTTLHCAELYTFLCYINLLWPH